MVKTQVLLVGFLILLGSFVLAQTEVVIENNLEISSSADHGGSLARPRICPLDTTWVAYEVRNQENTELWLVNTKTKEKRAIKVPVETDEFDGGGQTGADITRDLAWSPTKGDGGDIWAAFTSRALGNDELFLYNLNNGSVHRLAMAGASKRRSVSEPSWSPDGRCLTYTSTQSQNADIYIIRDMKWVMGHLEHEETPHKHSSMITGTGNQFGATWCTIEGAAYIAYTDQPGKSLRLRIRVWDPRPIPGVAYDMENAASDLNYFAPSWEQSGRRIAFYIEAGTAPSALDVSSTSTVSLGFAEVEIIDDKVIIKQKAGGLKETTSVMTVAPNDTKFQGPVWVNGSAVAIVSELLEEKQNPLRLVRYGSWSIPGQPTSRWKFTPKGQDFSFPRDINSVGNKITFTHGGAMKRDLLIATLGKSELFKPPKSYLSVSKDRAEWYSNWSEDAREGFLTQVWGFLKAPVFGPDIGINKNGVLIGGIITYLIIGGDDIIDLPDRDWDLPQFPS